MKRSHLCGILVTGALLASGCSGGEPGYDYAIPSRLCGVGVDQSDLKRILPPGDEGRAVESGVNDWKFHKCQVVVEEKLALNVRISRDVMADDAAKFGIKEFGENFRKISLSGPVTSAGVGDDGGLAWMKCQPKPGQPQNEAPDRPFTHLVLKIHTPAASADSAQTADHLSDMERFLRSYVPNLTEAWCT
ncbi:hypothetical protein OHA99_25345 [Streptomyces coelicoflavus]|uniref:hypothetical protein n=1 Tax=Streptomyces coelicoflavus TaxID=285562 RepID=UPI003251001E